VKENNTNLGNNNQKITEKDVTEYVLQRFDDVKCANKIQDVIKFQTINKYMLMAHDQIELKNLGNIVASYKKIPFSDLLQEYENHLKNAMWKKPTIKTHTNVIMHIFGYFSKDLNQNEKQKFFHMLEQFKENKINLGKMLADINSIAYKFDRTYLASQTYFLLYSDVQPIILFQPLNQNEYVNQDDL